MQTLIKNFEDFTDESEIKLMRTGGGVKGYINQSDSKDYSMYVIGSEDDEIEMGKFDLTKIDTSVVKSLVQKSIRRGDYDGIMLGFLLAYSFVADAAKTGKIETEHRSWMTNFTNRILIALPEDIGLTGIQVFPLIGDLIMKFNLIRFDYSKLDKMIGLFSEIAEILSDDSLKRIRQISFLRAFYYTNDIETIQSFVQSGSEKEVEELLEFDRNMEFLDGFKFYFKKRNYACFFYLLSILNEKGNSTKIKKLVEFLDKQTNYKPAASNYLKTYFKSIKNKDNWIFLAQLVIIGLQNDVAVKFGTDSSIEKRLSNGTQDKFDSFVELGLKKIYLKKYVFDQHVKGYSEVRNGTNAYFAQVSSKVTNEYEDFVDSHWKDVYVKMKLANDNVCKKRKRVEKVEKNKKIK